MIITTPAKETFWTLASGAIALAIFAYPISTMPRGTMQESILFWLSLINLIMWSVVVILRAYFFFTKRHASSDGKVNETTQK